MPTASAGSSANRFTSPSTPASAPSRAPYAVSNSRSASQRIALSPHHAVSSNESAATGNIVALTHATFAP
jgi:hypothetical protein